MLLSVLDALEGKLKKHTASAVDKVTYTLMLKLRMLHRDNDCFDLGFISVA